MSCDLVYSNKCTPDCRSQLGMWVGLYVTAGVELWGAAGNVGGAKSHVRGSLDWINSNSQHRHRHMLLITLQAILYIEL